MRGEAKIRRFEDGFQVVCRRIALAMAKKELEYGPNGRICSWRMDSPKNS